MKSMKNEKKKKEKKENWGNKPEVPETDKRTNVMKINNNNENIVVNSYKEYLYKYIKMFYTLCS